MATYSSVLVWKIPWMEEPGQLQSMVWQELDTTERLLFSFFLRWRDNSGLSQWTQCNHKHHCKSEAGVSESGKEMWWWKQRPEWFNDWTGPWAKECRQVLEAGKGRGWNLSYSLQKECSPVDTLTLAHKTHFLTSEPIKWKSLSRVWLCDPIHYTAHGILQARILEWVVFPFSRGSSQPRDQTQVSHTAGGFFTLWATREALWPIKL